ncbi:hypothetical protein V2I01_31620 [Micromonospora sp. BRA006-A]|nr:hypothetical protein [Micromonospora sp. BRA006-A]
MPANNTTRRVITIKPGTHRQVVRVPSNKPNITFQGLGPSRRTPRSSTTTCPHQRHLGQRQHVRRRGELRRGEPDHLQRLRREHLRDR